MSDQGVKMDKVTPRLGAIAVVIHEGAALLVQRSKEPSKGLWGFPGGHVEPGETGLAAAARELLEETGVVAEPLRYLTNADVLIHDGDGVLTHHFLLAAVACRYVSGTPVAADDAADARWVPLGRIEELPLTERVLQVLEAAL